ncbi:UDP-N-acetylmuramoyl-tripeptide--D-alanyl-D-alanine ligase, partial [Bradyrhizobium sp.]|uniref:UDP-N-acetylmuramoyl-tripeptide--D-alanyl-D- alanine ligase n=1 Tax=Bradyrhizobium sp. TaxID=376 RepID=UPI00391D91D7
MTKALWTVAEVARELGLAGDYPETPIDLVTQDSRAVKPGSLFVALSGTPSGGFVSSFASSRDGWEFAANAEQAGAVAMIVPHRIDGISVPQLVVPDTLIDGLWALARAARARFHGPVIGLTGSAGKTSTKEFIAAYPGASASPSSFNNFWGVPLTLCNADPSASVWVVEMGMNQQGEIARLTELSQPTVALVVNVQPVHLEKLGSLEAIRKEKVSIARGLPSDGILVLPVDLAAPEWPGRVLRFGAGADVHAISQVPAGESWDVTADIAGRHLAFSLTPGAPHRLHNALAALASVAAAGLDPVLLARELGEVGIMTGRGVEQRIGEIVLIDDSFNGNPASMAAALDSLQARPVRGRRIAVIGDMLELGDEAPAYHADMVG